ncbi:unnamed protein product, partial [Hymenolepis diminuta]|uniref:Uncharacterized protein n=1 Tax=Hymenolepis diminuta TaxID=6216 RepID=A0A0R3SCP3_HYMDI
MLKLIESQLGVSVSTKFLDENKIDSASAFRDITNKSLNVESILVGGNPLPLDEIINFSGVEDHLKLKCETTTSRFFNYSNCKFIEPEDLCKFYSTVGEGVLLPVRGSENSPPQLTTLLPGSSLETRRVLRIFTLSNVDRSVKLDQLQSQYMPFCREVNVSYEADYTLFFTRLHMEFSKPTCGLLSHPDSSTSVRLTTNVLPYSTEKSPLSSIKSDLDRIKRLFLAFQNEDTWIPLENTSLQSDLEEAIAIHLNDERIRHRTRDLDTTECLWEALKDVPNRRVAREGFLTALRLLQEKPDLLSVSLSNFTQFAKLARNHIMSGRGAMSTFDVQGLRMLIEAGIFKVTNDCIAAIRGVTPQIDMGFVNSFLRSEDACLDKRFELLHHLYCMACLTTALGAIAQSTVVLKEIEPLLSDVKNSEANFKVFMALEDLDMEQFVTHECTTFLKNLIAKVIE